MEKVNPRDLQIAGVLFYNFLNWVFPMSLISYTQNFSSLYFITAW